MSSLPEHAERYHRTQVFMQVPRGQRRVHHMRADTWSRLHVIEGAIAVVDDQHRDRHVLFGGESIDVAPGLPHHVEPWGPRVRFYLDLYHVPEDSPANAPDVSRWEGEGGSSAS